MQLEAVESTLNGDIIVRGNVKGKAAALTLSTAEALKIYRDLKAMDIEGLAKVFGS